MAGSIEAAPPAGDRYVAPTSHVPEVWACDVAGVPSRGANDVEVSDGG